jgi:endogenous inhibitor of DNA gyrase (YacG/DUF329 family)
MCNQVLEDVEDDYPSRPFCSARCKLIDLGNWLSEKYKSSRPLGTEDLDDDEYQFH